LKIAILKFGALGDVLRTTCLLKPLKRRYPDATIYWYTLKNASALLEGNPLIHQVIVEDDSNEINFDLVLSLDEDEAACRMGTRLKGRQRFGAFLEPSGRLGYTPDSASWFAMGLLNRDADGSLRTANAQKLANQQTYPSILFRMLNLEADPDDARPLLYLNDDESRKGADLLTAKGLRPGEFALGLNTASGARWRTKQMTQESAHQLMTTLHQSLPAARQIILGGPEEEQRNHHLAQLAPHAIYAGTHHSLREFAAILKACSGVITSDSLALHMAVAFNKPTLGFFGSTSAVEIEMGTRGVRWLPPASCRCFYRPACEEPRFCLDQLDHAFAVETIRTWMN